MDTKKMNPFILLKTTWKISLDNLRLSISVVSRKIVTLHENHFSPISICCCFIGNARF